jgi:hypothetical protein
VSGNPWYGERNKKRLLKKLKGHHECPCAGPAVMTNPFFLYVYESLRTVGVLTQLLGSWHCPVAYLSKQLDAVSRGWPPCLCTLAAIAFLVAEADKLFETKTHSEFPTLF